MKKKRLPIERYTARRPVEVPDVVVWDEDGEVYGVYEHFTGLELVRDLRALYNNESVNWVRFSELGLLLRRKSRRTLMKKILGALAVILGLGFGAFVVIARMHTYKLKAIEKITLEDVHAQEKLSEEEYNHKIGTIENELMSATMEEVIDGFRERFGVKP